MGALNESEKEQIRYHLGYLASSFAASFQLGIPRPLQTVFLLEQAMSLLVNDYALARARKLLCQIQAVEDKMFLASDDVGVEELGKIVMHPLRNRGMLVTDSLEKEYRRWTDRLADMLGVPKYPYSQRTRRGGPGSIVSTSG